MTGKSAFQMREEAAKWVARQDAGAWSPEDEEALQAWLDGDPRRPGALLQAQAAWMTLDEPVVEASVVGIVSSPSPVGRRAMLAGGGLLIAASVAGAWAWLGSATNYSTTLGEVRRVPLADGSVATINTESTVAVRIEDKRREVRMEGGEAWFQVAKDAARPFVVQAGRVRVKAVGTAFAVRRIEGGAVVMVTEGIVETWVEGAEGHRVRLIAGQRAFVADNAAISEQTVGTPTVDRALAWRSGRIDLAGETLSDAIAEFNRYNGRRIVLLNAALADEQFDGLFRTDDPEGFATAVHTALSIPIDLSDPAEIRIGRRR